MELITQDGITYKVINGVVKGWQGQSPFSKPLYNSGVIEEGWTAEDQINLDSQIEDITIGESLDKFEIDGVTYLKELRIFIRKQFNKGIITNAQYKGIRTILAPALQPLKLGDWDIAQDNLLAITPPTNDKMLLLYNRVKSKIDSYLI